LEEEGILDIACFVFLCTVGLDVLVYFGGFPDNLWTVILYQGADNSLARPTSRCILFDGENILFYASLVLYINSTNILPIMIISRIYEHQNLLSLQLISFLVWLRTYQHSCTYVQGC